MVTLEQVRGNADPTVFPRHVLNGCETGLVLFAAGFYGCQDAVWLAEAGIQATCVDHDSVRLEEMMSAYPQEWEYPHADVFSYAKQAKRTWDVVTVDCPTGSFDRCAALARLWCGLANRAVILGSGAETAKPDVPKDWRVTELVYRSDYRGGTYWTVLQKDTA